MKPARRPARDAYHHGDLRNALLEAAVHLIAEQGQEGFSLREAAREVGVSPAAAYRHFPDKLHLIAAMAAEAHGRLATSMERALGRLDEPEGSKARAVSALAAIGEAYVEFAVKHPAHFRVMFGEAYEVDDFTPGCAPSGRDAFQILLDTLDGLVVAGAIRPEARVGAELHAWSGVHGLAFLLVSGALPLPAKARQAANRSLSRAILLGMGVEPSLLPPGAPISVDPRLSPEAAKVRGKPPAARPLP